MAITRQQIIQTIQAMDENEFESPEDFVARFLRKTDEEPLQEITPASKDADNEAREKLNCWFE